MGDPGVFPADTVLLRHELPDGSWHIDWMIDLTQDPESRLATFRAERRIDELPPGQHLVLQKIADHRRGYLSYEGPVSDDRGHVSRLAAGRIDAIQSLGPLWAFLIRWRVGGGTRYQHLRLQPEHGERWILTNTGR